MFTMFDTQLAILRGILLCRDVAPAPGGFGRGCFRILRRTVNSTGGKKSGEFVFHGHITCFQRCPMQPRAVAWTFSLRGNIDAWNNTGGCAGAAQKMDGRTVCCRRAGPCIGHQCHEQQRQINHTGQKHSACTLAAWVAQ